MRSFHSFSDAYGFPCVPAQYTPHRLTRFSNNQLISAINYNYPQSSKELAGRLQFLPDWTDETRAKPGYDRRMLLQTLFRLTIATPRLVELAEKSHNVMCECYVGREIHSPSANSILHSLYQLQKHKRFTPSIIGGSRNTAQFSYALIAPPASGKSFAVNAIQELYPPVIHHEELGLYQIPTLTIEMMYRGLSLASLAHAILHELHRLFPLGEYDRLFKAKGNYENLILQVFALLHHHAVGHVFVDEAQNKDYDAAAAAEKARKDKRAPTIQSPVGSVMIHMSNRTQIPLLFTGTAELRAALGTRGSFKRRTLGSGLRPWGQLDPTSIDGRASEFDLFLGVLWKHQLLRNIAPLNPRLTSLFSIYTGRFPDFIVKLFHNVQWRALETGKESITEELVHQVANQEMADIVELVSAIEHRNDSSLARELLRTVSDFAAEYEVPEKEPFSDRMDGPKPIEKSLKDFRAQDLAGSGKQDNQAGKGEAKGTSPALSEADGAAAEAASPPSARKSAKEQKEAAFSSSHQSHSSDQVAEALAKLVTDAASASAIQKSEQIEQSKRLQESERKEEDEAYAAYERPATQGKAAPKSRRSSKAETQPAANWREIGK